MTQTGLEKLDDLEKTVREREDEQVFLARDASMTMGSYFINEQRKMLVNDGLLPGKFDAQQMWRKLLKSRGNTPKEILFESVEHTDPAVVREAFHQLVRLDEPVSTDVLVSVLRHPAHHGWDTVMCEAAIVAGRLGREEMTAELKRLVEYHTGVVKEAVVAASEAIEQRQTFSGELLSAFPEDTADLL